MSEFLLGVYNNPVQQGQTMGRVQGLRNIPVELCAPLHCMLAEAVALDPRSMFIPHMVLVFMEALQDIYFRVSGCRC
jgi:hypothetical protein